MLGRTGWALRKASIFFRISFASILLWVEVLLLVDQILFEFSAAFVILVLLSVRVELKDYLRAARQVS